jgi:uncharacterized cupin superfamily protein
MPRLDIGAISERRGSDYPERFRAPFEGRVRKRLGDAGGLTQFGVNLCRLKPGAMSALRHWHEREDELVYVLEGEIVLIEDGGETLLRPGDAAAFKAGVANGHHLVNRTERDALLLEIGTRAASERAHYSDVDMIYVCEDGVGRFLRRSGAPFED